MGGTVSLNERLFRGVGVRQFYFTVYFQTSKTELFISAAWLV